MNETVTSNFQIKPDANDYRARCVFMNKGFNLDDVMSISDVYSWELTTHYRFTVEFYGKRQPFHFDFHNKARAVKANRELLRAWTRTGEFAYERPREEIPVAAGLEDN